MARQRIMRRVKRISVHLGNGWKTVTRATPAGDDPDGMWTPQPFQLEGGWTDLVDAGDGPALLLLPPLPGYKEAWIRCVPVLARHFRVVTFDLRARCGREAPWEVLLADVDRVVERLQLDPVALVGHSLGGALALRWALARPARARALVLSSAFTVVDTPPVQWSARFLEQPLVLAALRFLPRAWSLTRARALTARHGWVFDSHCDDEVLRIVIEGARRCPIGVALERVRMAYAHDVRERLAEIKTPALVVAGERDTWFALREARVLAGALTAAPPVLSPEGGHLHPLSRPGWLTRALIDWAPLGAARRAL